MIATLLFSALVVIMSLLYLAGWFWTSICKYQERIDNNNDN